MKKVLPAIIAFLMLSGCRDTADYMDRVLLLRKNLLNSEGISCQCTITADYGDSIYSFTLDCKYDKKGNMQFTVCEPESICGITGKVSGEGGQLIFDEQMLSFPVLADGYLSPVSAPWFFMKTLRSGRIDSCGDSENGFIVKASDSYNGQAMQMDITLNEKDTPIFAEFIWDGRRILSISVSDFCYL